jgi:HEAT repeat protein
MGQYSPWVVRKWDAEEAVANTLFKKKREMNEAVRAAAAGTQAVQDETAAKLAETALRDPIILTRLQAIKMLGQLNCQVSHEALDQLGHEPDIDVRLAVVEAWRKMPATSAVPALQSLVGSDTNVDVRLAATRALGDFPGQASVQALRLALTDGDPAIQLRATESLGRVTGESFGANVASWKNYVNQTAGSRQVDTAAQADPNSLQR